MRRIRTIKPEFPDSLSMGRICRDARLLFILLWTMADDDGRVIATPRYVASRAFPYDDDAPAAIGGWLEVLEAEGCIRRYRVDGTDYLAITNWDRHQKIDRRTPSKLPAPPSTGVEPSSREVTEGSVTPRAGLVEDSSTPRGVVVDDSRSLARAPADLDLGPTTKDQGPETENKLQQPPADKSAWRQVESAISESYGGASTRRSNGLPYAHVGQLLAMLGRYSGDDPAKAERLWRQFWPTVSADPRYTPSMATVRDKLGAWLAGRNGKSRQPWTLTTTEGA